jgi:hypothetical protein
MPVEDTLLLTSQAKIRELEEMLKKKDLEISDIRFIYMYICMCIDMYLHLSI